mgnify:CR=1 FL=1
MRAAIESAWDQAERAARDAAAQQVSQLKVDVETVMFHEIGHFFEVYKALEPGKASVVGAWRVDEDAKGRMIMADATPYPDSLNEGVIAGICTKFSARHPSYKLIDATTAKRSSAAPPLSTGTMPRGWLSGRRPDRKSVV